MAKKRGRPSKKITVVETKVENVEEVKEESTGEVFRPFNKLIGKHPRGATVSTQSSSEFMDTQKKTFKKKNQDCIFRPYGNK